MELILLIICVYLFLCGYCLRTGKMFIPIKLNIFLLLFLPPIDQNNLV